MSTVNVQQSSYILCYLVVKVITRFGFLGHVVGKVVFINDENATVYSIYRDLVRIGWLLCEQTIDCLIKVCFFHQLLSELLIIYLNCQFSKANIVIFERKWFLDL